MAKKKCTPPKNFDEYVDRTQPLVDEWLEGLAGNELVASIKLLHFKIQADDPVAGEAFKLIMEEKFPAHIANAAFSETKISLSLAPTGVQAAVHHTFVDEVHDIDGRHRDSLPEETAAQVPEDDSPKTRFAELKIGDGAGIDAFKPYWEALTGEMVDPAGFAKIVDTLVPETQSFDDFIAAIDSLYDGFTGTDEQIRYGHRIYVGFHPKNKMKAEDKNVAIYTNLDPNIADIKEAILPTTDMTFQSAREIDVKTGSLEPIRVSKSFLDDSKALFFGKPLSEVITHVPVSKMNKVIDKKGKVESDDPGYWVFDAQFDMSPALINKWNLDWGNNTALNEQGNYVSKPSVFAGINSGDPPTLMFVSIPAEVFHMLLPREEVVAEVDRWKADFPKIAKFIESRRYSLFIALRDAREALKEMKRKGNRTKKGFVTKTYTDGLKRYRGLQTIAARMAAPHYIEYFQGEVITIDNPFGSITKDQMDDIIANIENIPMENVDNEMVPYIPMHLYLGGIIATHEFWKAARYNTYAKDNARKTYDRFRITKVPGLVEVGRGERTHLGFDTNRVNMYYTDPSGVEYKIEHIKDIPGIGKKWIGDGMSMNSDHDLDTTAVTMGSYPIHAFESNIGEAKAVDVHRSEDGNDYFEKKHSSQRGIAGIEIRDKRTGDTIGWIKEEGKVGGAPGRIRIFATNPEGGPPVLVDEWGSLDEFKTLAGKYDIVAQKKSSFIATVPEDSRRIVILPPTVAHTTVAGPRQWLPNLYITGLPKEQQADLDFFRDTIEEYMMDMVDKHTDALVEVLTNPQSLRKLLRHKWAQEADIHDNLKSLLAATKGKGIHHLNFLTQIHPMLNNMMVRNGILSFRTYEDKINRTRQDVVGTDGVIKADMTGMLGDRHNEVAIGEGLSVLVDYVERKMAGILSEGEYKEFKKKPKHRRIEILNDFLNTDEGKVMVMSWRYPILSLGSVGIFRIAKIMINEGQAMYYTPMTVFKKLVGDQDYDHASMLILPEETALAAEAFMDTEYFKAEEDITAQLDLFKRPDSASMLDYNGRIQEAVDQMKGNNSIGMMSNMKTVTAVMSYKMGKVTLHSGTVVVPKNPNDTVVMNYAPLKQDMPIKELESYFPKAASVIEAPNGEWYLQTTVAHEHTLINNAATDHPKSGILVNQWGYNSELWRVDKMWKVVKGPKVLNPNDKKVLNKLADQFNYSKVLKGKTTSNRPMKFKTFWYVSKLYHDQLTSPPEVQVELYKAKVNSLDAFNKKVNVGIKDMELNGKLVLTEKILIRPMEKLIEKYGLDNIPEVPGYLPDKERRMVRWKALNELQDDIVENQDEYDLSSDAIEAAEQFITKFAGPYYDMFYGKKNEKGEYDAAVSIAKAKFDEDLWEYVKRGEAELNRLVGKHGNGVAVWSTLLFTQGVGSMQGTEFIKRKKIEHFPPVEVLDVATIAQYFTSWEKHSLDEAARKDFSALDEAGRQKWHTAQLLRLRKC